MGGALLKEEDMNFRTYLADYVLAWARLIDCIMVIVTFGLVTLTSARNAVYVAARTRLWKYQ